MQGLQPRLYDKAVSGTSPEGKTWPSSNKGGADLCHLWQRVQGSEDHAGTHGQSQGSILLSHSRLWSGSLQSPKAAKPAHGREA